MASPEVVDLAKLCAALDGDQPVGLDLRNDTSPQSAYYAVKDARNAARAAERRLMSGEGEDSPPDWRPVMSQCLEILAEQTKDLEIAAYLIEALVRLHGFAGLRDGFILVTRLCEQYWDGLYPLPDEDGLETKVAPLTGLNGADGEGTLINPITRVPLTEGSSVGPFACSDYQQALTIAQITDEAARENRLAQGAVSLAMFERAVQETPASFYAELMEDLAAALDELARLGNVVSEKCGAHAPPTSAIRSALESCKEAVQHVAAGKLASAAEALADGAEATSGSAPAASGDGLGALRDRESAFQTLLKVAEFFRRTEPHSPLSYTLEQAVRWGRMSLPELVAELIPDEGPRQGFFKQVGIRKE